MDKINSVRNACKITDKIWTKILKNIKYIKTEKEFESFILNKIRQRGLKPSFDPIVASNRNAANPHHKPNNTKLEGFIVVDFGVRYNGYCSDMTRMIYFGNISKEETKIYELVLSVQNSAIKGIIVDKKYMNISKDVRHKMGEYNKYFIHSLGHGVGRKIHQKPRISVKSKDIVKEGDIITIEPGIYIKNKLGIRIEDTIVVNKNEVDILTRSSKELIIIK